MTRTFDPISALQADHRQIQQELALLAKDLRVIGSNWDAEAQHPLRWPNLRNGMRFLSERVQLHAQQEDEALFPALKQLPELASVWSTVVEQDRYLHRAFGALEDMWKETDARHALGQSIPEAEIPFLVRQSLELMEVLRAHMGFEEANIFAVASQRLSDAEKQAIARQMAEIGCRSVELQSCST